MIYIDDSRYKLIGEKDPSSECRMIDNGKRLEEEEKEPKKLPDPLSLPCPPPPDFNINARYFVKYFDSDALKTLKKKITNKNKNKIKPKLLNSLFIYRKAWIVQIKVITGRDYKTAEISHFIRRKWRNESEDHKEFYRKIAKEVKVLYYKRFKKSAKKQLPKSTRFELTSGPPTLLQLPYPIGSPQNNNNQMSSLPAISTNQGFLSDPPFTFINNGTSNFNSHKHKSKKAKAPQLSSVQASGADFSVTIGKTRIIYILKQARILSNKYIIVNNNKTKYSITSLTGSVVQLLTKNRLWMLD
nr:3843_t:CDS:2 [Entrophospora candida]